MKHLTRFLWWGLWFTLLLSTDVHRWITKDKPLRVEKLIHAIIFAAVFGWLTTLSHVAWAVGFFAWAGASVLCLIGLTQVERNMYPSSLMDTVLNYTAEFLPFLVAVCAVTLWLRKQSQRADQSKGM